MLINILMVVSLVAALVSFWKWDKAISSAQRWEGRDAVRFAEAREACRRWRLIAGVAVVAYLAIWWVFA